MKLRQYCRPTWLCAVSEHFSRNASLGRHGWRSLAVEPLEDRRLLSVGNLYVDPDSAAPAPDGKNWESAYVSLQEALDRAVDLNNDTDPDNNIDQIWIAEGTYTPTALLESGDARSASFSLVDGVSLYGGFAGTEGTIEERDASKHVTTLSGDLGVVDDNSDNAYTVVYYSGDLETGINGVSITGGNANGSDVSGHFERRGGGGIYSHRGTLTVANCTIANNSVDGSGGGIFKLDGTLTITNSTTLSGNTAKSIGGGICNVYGTLAVTNSTVSGNTASMGGGVYNSPSGILAVTHSNISGNSAASHGGGIYNYSGTSTVMSSTLAGNSAGRDGGGIHNSILASGGTMEVENSTLSGNSAMHDGGGIYRKGASTVAITNTIVAGNAASGAPDIYGLPASGSDHSLIGIWNGVPSLDASNLFGTSASPLDPRLGPLGDYGGPTSTMPLLADSPAIDAGSNTSAIEAGLTTDQRGADRFVDGNHDGGATTDIGAFEFSRIIHGRVWEDLNENGIQDTSEMGVPGVSVSLLDPGLSVVVVAKTDSDGNYAFHVVSPGEYSLEFTSPGIPFSAQNQGGDKIDSDVDPETGRTESFILDAAANVKRDAGLASQVTAQTGGVVWEDLDGSGTRAPGENGIGGVSISLWDEGNVEIATTISAVDGTYVFGRLGPGEYSVEFDRPRGYFFTAPDQDGTDLTDSDASPSTGRTAPFTLLAAENDRSQDAGMFRLGSIGGFVWFDADQDGVRKVEEGAMPNVEVRLLDRNLLMADSTVTTLNGSYEFSQLPPSEYTVEFVSPAGITFSPKDRTDNSFDSDAEPTSGRTDAFVLASGTTMRQDAGVFGPGLAEVGNLVWEDSNGNGIQDDGEAGIGGVAVSLLDLENVKVATTITAADGTYMFTGLWPGDYSIKFDPPKAYLFTSQDQGVSDLTDSDAAPSTGQTALFTLLAGEANHCWDAGIYRLGSISGFVWEDLNENGIQEPEERGMPMADVRLIDADGNSLQTTTTNEVGRYAFPNLPPGQYATEFVAPRGGLFTSQDQGGNDALDSDADRESGRTLPFLLRSGDTAVRNAGILSNAAWPIGWQVMEIEAKWATDESVLEQIKSDFNVEHPRRTFTLAGISRNYDIEVRWGGVPAKFTDSYYDNEANAIADANHALRYRVSDAWDTTDTAPNFDDDLSSLIEYDRWAERWEKIQYKGDPKRFGAVWMRNEFGNAQLTSEQVSGTLNGETLAIHNGDDPVAGAKADHPDLVWLNGTPVENRISDSMLVVDFRYRIRFLEPATGEPRYELSLDKARRYHKDQNGEYTIHEDLFEVELEALSDDGNGEPRHTEMEIDELFHLVSWFEQRYPMLMPSVTSKSGNAISDSEGPGYWGVSGSVWEDVDNDGIHDTTENGIPGVTVRLLDDALSTVATTSTETNGFYGFHDLWPGEYSVEFVSVGTRFTAQDQGNDDRIDSDVDPTIGRTSPFSFPQQGKWSVGRDAGLVGTLSGGRISGVVWDDTNGDGILGMGEAGTNSAVVRLLDNELTPIATVVPNAIGQYEFPVVSPGEYSLELIAQDGWTVSPMNRGDDDLVDSDINRATNRTSPFHLIAGQNDTSHCAGLYCGPLSTEVRDSLRITEIGFRDPEFIELKNIGSKPIDLTGVRFTCEIAFGFSQGDVTALFPGEHVVLTNTQQGLSPAFVADEIMIAGQFDQPLGDRGARITLVDSMDRTVMDFAFNPEWFALVAQDEGFALTLRNDAADWTDRSGWRPSSRRGGSPGVDDPQLAPDPGAVLFNEILSNPSGIDADWIELYNTTDEDIDISGWYLGDDQNGDPRFAAYQIATDTILPAGGYVVLDRFEEFGFGVSSYGERLQLTAGDQSGDFLGYSEWIAFGGAEVGVTLGAYRDDFVAQSKSTPGLKNAEPAIGPVVIHEIMYCPTDNHVEFVELYNVSAEPVDVSGWNVNGIKYRLPPESVIDPESFLLVVASAPEDFREVCGIADSVPIVGPFQGRLDNAGENLRLYKYDEFNRKILVDQINYDNEAPWPEDVDRNGGSLERVVPTAYGNDPANWLVTAVSGGTPGHRNTVSAAKSWLGGDNVWTAAYWSNGSATGLAPVNHAEMVVDVAGSIVRVEQDFVSAGMGPAGSVAIGETERSELNVNAVLEVDNGVTIGPQGILSGTGTLLVGDEIAVMGTLAPGNGIDTLTLTGGVVTHNGSAITIELSGSGIPVKGTNNDVLAVGDLTLTGNPTLELEWLPGERGDGMFGGIYTIATYTGTLSGMFGAATFSAAYNGADASAYIDTTYGAGGIDYGSGTNGAITVKLKDLILGDANLDGDVDVWQIDGKGDAQLLTSNLNSTAGMTWSDGDFNFDGDVDEVDSDGSGDAQVLMLHMGASLDNVMKQEVVREPAESEPLPATLDWQYEFERTQSKAAQRRAVEAAVDLLLATAWQ